MINTKYHLKVGCILTIALGEKSWQPNICVQHFRVTFPGIFSNVKRHWKSILLVCGYKSSKTQILTIVLISLNTRQMQFVSMYFPMSEHTLMDTHSISYSCTHGGNQCCLIPVIIIGLVIKVHKLSALIFKFLKLKNYKL
jgi:xanthine/uracil/vitamin C permease (AzgA family)